MTKDHWYRLIFEEFLDRTEDGFIVVDKDGVITDINQNYCDFLSRKREDIVGKPIGQVITTTSMYDVLSRKLRGDVGRIYIQPYSVGETRDQSEVYAVANRFCFFEEDGTLLGAAAHMKFRQRAMDTARELQELELQYYKEAYQQSFSGKGGFSCIVGQDPKLLELKRYGIQVARTDFPVLITGETGTGKEVFAKAIHLESDRRDGPFIAVNCGAIPDNLLESELFGYEEGAFTGARKGGKPGKFQLANHGTLFLDEIGDMPFPLQVKLLRVLQDQQVERVAVINMETIPLRERPGDILLHANHYLEELNRKYKTSIVLSDRVKHCLRAYSWPGNVRELQNVLAGAYASCDKILIDVGDLPTKVASRHLDRGQDGQERSHLAEIVDAYEASVIREALRHNGENVRLAALELGVERSLLYKKMKRLGISLRRVVE